jgi:glycerophosphoryl diester phosphodiesterase
VTPKIIAHRGVTRNKQENTLPAFQEAFSEGADGLEIDVRLSKDEKPIIFHDEDTSRLFQKSLEIKNTTYSELKTLGNKENRIPLLDEVLDFLPKNKHCYIEIKSDAKTVPFLDKLKIEKNNITFLSFDKNVIAALKNRFPNKLAFQNFHTLQIERYGIKKILEFYKKGNSDGLSIDIRNLSNKTIDKLLEKKIDLIIWTLNSMGRFKELSKKNVRAIITDEVKDFADFLKRKS